MSTPLNKISTIFFGTHDFAAEILQGLIESPLIDIKLVITQPDKPVGRKKELTPPPVKILAEKYGLKIEQPDSLKFYNLTPNTYTLGITVQYGLLIPKDILKTPKYEIINVHASLLPKYRGASPIQSVLINDETKTGVTIMLMDEGLDTGQILAQKSLIIDPDDTYLTLSEKLVKRAKTCLLEAISDYTAGKLTPKPQDKAKASLCKELTRDDGRIDWSKTNQEIYNLYRGLTPWPGIWTNWHNKHLKLHKIKLAKLNLPAGQVSLKNDKINIGCAKGAIEVLNLQLAGKQPMQAKDFINGYHQIDGKILN